jgi:hypothetical protein
MFKLLEYIFLFWLLFLLLRPVLRLLMGVVFRQLLSKASAGFQGQQTTHAPRRRPGETSVEYVPENPKTQHPADEGEYIDYKEVK